MIARGTQKQSNMINSQLYEKILEEDMYEPQEEHSLTEYPPHQLSQQSASKIQMVIEYGNNKTASLWVGSADDPTTLAKRFCYKYNIDPHVINTLAANIRTLQMNSFSEERSEFKIEKNSSHFDDKQNHNRSNLPRSRSKSHEKMNESSLLKMSRNKTNQSNGIPDSNSSRFNVFERLYKDSKRKGTKENNQSKRSQNSRMSLNATNNNKSLNQSSIQSCLQIYQKNTKLKQQLQKHNQQLHELKSQKQLEKCSFKPQINPLSSLIAVKLRELDESSIMNRSSNDRQMTKIKDYLLKRQEQEMKQCTFKPKILSKMSKESSSYSSTQRYKQLHEDHIIREAKKKTIGELMNREQEQKHQPAINRVSKIVVQKNFFQRLEEDVQKRVSKKESVQKIVNQKGSQRRPSTGRAPVNRSKGDKTIGQYLYELSRKSRALSTKQQPQILTDPHSNQLHQKSKQISIQYIFQLLDSDRDGLISSTKICISALPQEVLKLLAPLLSEMEQVGVELNLQEFAMALERLYSTFSVAEKNVILKVYKNKEMDSRAIEKPNFTPNLNQYSLKIARELSSDDIDIYQNSLVRIKEKENKLNRLRAEKMLDQYSECTFHPKIHY